MARFRQANTGMATAATRASPMPTGDASACVWVSRLNTAVTTTYPHKRTSATAVTHAARCSARSTRSSGLPWASSASRHSNTPPATSSMMLSRPKAVSATLRATMPALRATAASTSIQASVTCSTRTPARTRVVREVGACAARDHACPWAKNLMAECLLSCASFRRHYIIPSSLPPRLAPLPRGALLQDHPRFGNAPQDRPLRRSGEGWQRRLVLQTLAEAVALAVQEQDVAAMHQPIQQGRGHALMAKHLRPMGEIEVRGQRHTGALVAIREELEEQLSRRLREGQIAQFVDQDERVLAVLRQQLGQAQLLLRHFQLVGQRGRGTKEHAGAA